MESKPGWKLVKKAKHLTDYYKISWQSKLLEFSWTLNNVVFPYINMSKRCRWNGKQRQITRLLPVCLKTCGYYDAFYVQNTGVKKNLMQNGIWTIAWQFIRPEFNNDLRYIEKINIRFKVNFSIQIWWENHKFLWFQWDQLTPSSRRVKFGFNHVSHVLMKDLLIMKITLPQ